MDFSKNGGVWKVYAAHDYDDKNPRTDNYVEVNLPDYMPTIPQDGNYTNVPISSKYFVNDNYPNSAGTVKSTHYLKLPLLQGTVCPVYFPKGSVFLLFTPTTKIEEGYLLFVTSEVSSNGGSN